MLGVPWTLENGFYPDWDSGLFPVDIVVVVEEEEEALVVEMLRDVFSPILLVATAAFFYPKSRGVYSAANPAVGGCKPWVSEIFYSGVSASSSKPSEQETFVAGVWVSPRALRLEPKICPFPSVSRLVGAMLVFVPP